MKEWRKRKVNLGANGILTYIVKKEKDVPSLQKAYELVETDMIECVNLMGGDCFLICEEGKLRNKKSIDMQLRFGKKVFLLTTIHISSMMSLLVMLFIFQRILEKTIGNYLSYIL